jgi:hypothetical protein
LLEALDLVHGIREVQSRRGRDGHPVLDVEPHDRLMVPSML